MSGTRRTALIAAGLFLANVAINAPLFLPGEHKYRDSIEGGYASMARFLSEHPNPFGWNPLQYRGLPVHDWYLPVLPYVSALAIDLFSFLKPEHVYRLVVVTMICLGPVTLFFFALEFTRSRRWSLLAAALYTCFSVSYSIYPAIESDQGITYVPWRVQVLVKYGEGPHNTGLVLLPLALIACWRAATGRRFSQLVVAAGFLAVVTLTNWIAAVALAWCCLAMLLVGPASSPETGFLARRVLSAALLAYLLAAFWLTPGLIYTSFFNWPVDAFGYRAEASKLTQAAGLILAPLAIAALFRRWPKRFYLGYLLVCLSGFAWIVSFHYWKGIDVLPESRRYAIEFEFFFFAASVELLRLAWSQERSRVRDAALIAFGAFLGHLHLQPWTYLTRTWIMLRPAPRDTAIEYQVAERLAAFKPDGRVFVFGGTRFRLNSWFPLPQVGGSFETGLRNRGATDFAFHIQKGPERPLEERGNDALAMMRAVGVEYAAIHGPASREHWRDIRDPDLVASKLEPVWREREDAIYRVPFTGLANFVLPQELPAGMPVARGAGALAPYIRALDNRERPAVHVRWEGNESIVLESPAVRDGYLITLRVSHHPGWRAAQDGKPVPVSADQMGNILLTPQPRDGPSTIRLTYRPDWQQVTGTVVSLITLAWCIVRIRRERTRRAEV